MKKNIVLSLFAAFVFFAMVACGTDTAAVQPQETPDAVIGEEPEPVLDDTQVNLEACIGLIGKDDASAASLLGGGIENIAGDGVTRIGRIYSVNLFGEETDAGTIYDGDGYVCGVTAQLENPDAAVYGEILRSFYGEPSESSAVISEGGATWEAWNIGDCQLRLYQQYGLSSLEITRLPTTGG